MHRELLEIPTRRRGLVDVTAQVQSVVARAKIDAGLCHVFVRHTSASLVVQENADPSVLRDLESFLSDLAPESRPWEHDAEGPDDMPAHAKSALTKTSETLPVDGGRLALGTWQALYLWEHRTAPHVRQLVVTVQG
jgi:secondary thiamine-phosphate synthase enzyme